MNDRVNKLWDKSKQIAKSDLKIKRLIAAVGDKISKVKIDEQVTSQAITAFTLLTSMISDYVHGRYRSFSNKSILMFVFSLVYFLTPVDLIPDFLPVIGFADDISIMAYVFKSFADDITAYKEWRSRTQ